MTVSEVMRSASFWVMGSPVQVAHVGAQNSHLFERPLCALWYDIVSLNLGAKLSRRTYLNSISDLGQAL
jgi:hypothetical protein